MKLLKHIDFIKYPILSDKSTELLKLRQYCFLVDKRLHKLEAKRAVEFLFAVRVSSVNSCNRSPKCRQIGKFSGRKPSYKKIIVTLAPGNSISLFADS
ncbi:ribosomal protein L23 (plastid) [Cryptomonas paramecium]|uniref:Ribosomal protein L23 n=1 Tax=Cryptomonas paramaecium TaxID=2898 RepID=D2IS96_9CRYP|nr:ribosomal protein L23 [Cryptomonas paramecium]ACT46788.1 ribosomal protein L23 [Cryptomonas paramecium]